jgi:hypothetical protein
VWNSTGWYLITHTQSTSLEVIRLFQVKLLLSFYFFFYLQLSSFSLLQYLLILIISTIPNQNRFLTLTETHHSRRSLSISYPSSSFIPFFSNRFSRVSTNHFLSSHLRYRKSLIAHSISIANDFLKLVLNYIVFNLLILIIILYPAFYSERVRICMWLLDLLVCNLCLVGFVYEYGCERVFKIIDVIIGFECK